MIGKVLPSSYAIGGESFLNQHQIVKTAVEAALIFAAAC